VESALAPQPTGVNPPSCEKSEKQEKKKGKEKRKSERRELAKGKFSSPRPETVSL
jgi:hypothetical protein